MAVLSLTLALATLLAPQAASAAEAPVDLGTAGSFVVLAGAGVTNTGPTALSGDLGTCPTPAITGFPPGAISMGTIHADDALACAAQSDLTTAVEPPVRWTVSMTITPPRS